MAKKPLSENDVIDILNPPTFRSDDEDLPKDPLVKARITVTLDDLQPYDRNPRKIQNPHFSDIKASILNRGLDHPPKVTRRNPTEPLMIKDGGNTRLEILRELWTETGDERWYRIEVDFEPWTSEIDALAGHMAENEQRGDLLFIEKAMAAADMRALLEKKTDKPLSGRELARQITAQGWTLNQAHLTRYEYATRRLIETIPTALWAGIGHSAVAKLRRFDNTYGAYWAARAGDSLEETFDEVFVRVLKENDDDAIDFEAIRTDLDIAVGEALGIDHYTVAVECDALSAGGSLTPPTLSPTEVPPEDAPPGTAGEQPPVTTSGTGMSKAPPATPPARRDRSGQSGRAQGASVIAPPTQAPAIDLKSLRARFWTLARKIALGNGLPDDMVLTIPEYFGVLIDLPAAPFNPVERQWHDIHIESVLRDTPERILPGVTWHWLASYTMQTAIPWVMASAPAGTRLGAIMQSLPEITHNNILDSVYGDGITVIPNSPMPALMALMTLWSSDDVILDMDDLRDTARQIEPLIHDQLREACMDYLA